VAFDRAVKGMKLEIFTDGASTPHHPEKPGGWAWAYKKADGSMMQSSGGKYMTTNNQMEMWAVIDAMNHVPMDATDVVVYSDSQYVVKGINEWISGWNRRGWKTADGKQVANIPLWNEMTKARNALQDRSVRVRVVWVKGHATSEMNNYVDRLCVKAKGEV
jgi:ribonuclease HI